MDTLNYCIAGYAAFTGLILAYIARLFWLTDIRSGKGRIWKPAIKSKVRARH